LRGGEHTLRNRKKAGDKEQGTAAVGQESVQQALQRRSKERKVKYGKKEHFLRMRMWVGYLVSLVAKDRGKVPDNIGNRILITNNLVVTKGGMTSIVLLQALSLETPQCLLSRISEELRKHGSHAILDFVIKNEPYNPNLNDSGLKSRIDAWEKALDYDWISDYEKEIAARCLYTVDVVRSAEKMFRSRLFLLIRADTGSKLTEAERIIYKYLDSIKCGYLPIAGDVKGMLKYISIVSNRRSRQVKDIKAVVNSERTLMQLLPNSGGMNDKKGLMLGTDVQNYSPYIVDFESITSARNLYCYAPSGGGKTVIALNLCCSAVEMGWCVCVQDIKGNEFTNFVNGTGGYIVSMRQMSPGFINSFIMHEGETTDVCAEQYFRERVAFSKRQLMILASIEGENFVSDLEELLDEFLSAVYISIGVLASNRATWERTKQLNPFVVYEMFVRFMTPEMQRKYSGIARKLMAEYRMYMSKSGSKSYLFTEEFNYYDILKANTLMFDFGLLEGSSQNVDRTLFRLKFEYMRKLNAEYAAYKYKCGKKVLKVLEESQIAVNDPEIMKGYVEEYTLRRAQGQTSLLLGNSVTALVDNPISRPLTENVKALILGQMSTEAQNDVKRVFGLGEEAEWIEKLGTEPKYENAFLFVNRMQPTPTTPILKVLLEPCKDSGYKKYKLLTPVSTGL